nr:MAG: putative capsid protein [Arizlama virus]
MYSALNKGYRRNRKRANVTSRLSYALSRQRRSRGTIVAAARQLNSASRGLQLQKGEFKSVDVQLSGDCNTTGSVLLVNGIARGDEIFERTGRQIVMKSVELRWQVASTTTTGIAQTCRIMLVYDRQANGAAPTILNVIRGAADGFLPHQPRNLENRRRFTILYDRTFVVGPQGTSTTALGVAPIVADKFYRKLNHPVEFNSGDAGTIADITTGSLYVLTIGNVAAGDTDALMNAVCRVRYQDK